MNERLELFENWASNYDPANDVAEFPFAGYDAVLDGMVALTKSNKGARVLELGVGTGNFAARFSAAGYEVWGLDFSREMLTRAREKLPTAHLLQADVLTNLPAELPEDFAVIASAYVLHEFPLASKVDILIRGADHLAEGGVVIVGDIAFETVEARDQARQRYKDAWDDAEHYWAVDEAAATLDDAGFAVRYMQVSVCAGIFALTW